MTTKTPILLSLTLVLVLAAVQPAHSGSKLRRCRQACAPAVFACAETGETPRRCARRIVRGCMRDGQTCGVTSVTVTTTTVPYFYYPTTTLPDVTVRVDPDSVRTFFELGLTLPAPEFQFVAADTTVENHTRAPFTPWGLQLDSGGLGYPPFYNYGFPQFCGSPPVILSGGSYTCTALFQVPDGTSSGRMELTPYPGATGPVSEEFAIDPAPRPFAGLQVTSVGSAASGCVPRTGFRMFEVALALSSHQGASEMTLSLYGFSLVAGEARYRPAWCGLVGADCNERIGVPVDGSATCSLAFEIPASLGAATLDFNDGRYRAAVDFPLP